MSESRPPEESRAGYGAERQGRSSGLPHEHRRARRPAGLARLTRSQHRVVGGVAAGVAELVGADPRIVRLLWVLSLPLSGGLTAVAYLALWALLPPG